MPLTPPPPAPNPSDPLNFEARADAHIAWQATNVAEMTALQLDVSAKQSTVSIAAEAVLSAVDAAMAAGLADAADNAATATTKASVATTKADEAQTSADDAAASAASASAVSGIPSLEGNASKFLRVTAGGLGMEWVAYSGVTMSGNLAPHVTQTEILTITNYDSATTYAVTATGGTVSRSGDTITYVAGSTAGMYVMTVVAGSETRSVPITVQPAIIAAPGIVSPAAGATGLGQSPAVTTGAFTPIGAADIHLNTDYEIRTAASGAGTLIASSLANSANKTSWTIPSSLLAVSTTYYARARHRGTALGAGAWSESSFTTAAEFTPTVPGTAYQGGFYAGRIVIAGIAYAIIVAPKSAGYSATKAWKTTDDTTSGTRSLNDGTANSDAMNNYNHPAAQFCRWNVASGGYTDWYLPSRDELEVCYRNLKPTTVANLVYASRIPNIGPTGNGVDTQGNGDNDNSSPVGAAYTTADPTVTTASAFKSGGPECFEAAYYYLTSTEFKDTAAWAQLFSSGSQDAVIKSTGYSVRAVRKVVAI